MEGKEPESKYLVMWVCVFIAAGIIFTGWIFALKYNFGQINAKMDKDVNKTTDQAYQEVQGMFAGVGTILDSNDKKLSDEQAAAAAAQAKLDAEASATPSSPTPAVKP